MNDTFVSCWLIKIRLQPEMQRSYRYPQCDGVRSCKQGGIRGVERKAIFRLSCIFICIVYSDSHCLALSVRALRLAIFSLPRHNWSSDITELTSYEYSKDLEGSLGIMLYVLPFIHNSKDLALISRPDRTNLNLLSWKQVALWLQETA